MTKKKNKAAVDLSGFGITEATDLPMTQGEKVRAKNTIVEKGLTDPQLQMEDEADEKAIEKFYNNAINFGIAMFCVFVVYFISKGPSPVEESSEF